MAHQHGASPDRQPLEGDRHDAHQPHAPGHYEHEHENEHHAHEHHGGVRGWVRRLFHPHSHDAANSLDPALESSARGIRAVKASLAILAATAALQALVVAVSGSVALFADTVHNLSDALTAVPLWIAFLVGRRRPDRRYTYGYGRAEDLAGLFIVGMIALSAVLAGVQAVRRLIDPAPVDHLGWVALAALIGFLGNELVAVYRIRVGRAIASAALVADGLHARTDGLTSLAVLAGAGGMAAGFPLADPLIGLLITVAILAVLRTAVRDVYRRLMDAVDPHLVDTAETTLRAVPGVVAVRRVRMRWLGHELHAEVDLDVDASVSLAHAHALAHDAEGRLAAAVRRLASATVHAYPAARDEVAAL